MRRSSCSTSPPARSIPSQRSSSSKVCRLMKGRTTITIAHRLGFARAAAKSPHTIASNAPGTGPLNSQWGGFRREKSGAVGECIAFITDVMLLTSTRLGMLSFGSRSFDGSAYRCRRPVTGVARLPGVLWAAWPRHDVAFRAQSVVAAVLGLRCRDPRLATRRESALSTSSATCRGKGHGAVRGGRLETAR